MAAAGARHRDCQAARDSVTPPRRWRRAGARGGTGGPGSRVRRARARAWPDSDRPRDLLAAARLGDPGLAVSTVSRRVRLTSSGAIGPASGPAAGPGGGGGGPRLQCLHGPGQLPPSEVTADDLPGPEPDAAAQTAGGSESDCEPGPPAGPGRHIRVRTVSESGSGPSARHGGGAGKPSHTHTDTDTDTDTETNELH